jgi:hypothetical protein
MKSPSRKSAIRSRPVTAALLTLGCSLGVNLAPLMAAPRDSTPALLTSEQLKEIAGLHKLSATQIKMLQDEIDVAAADQRQLTADQEKIDEMQKLRASQEKIKALQQKILLDEQKLTSDRNKLLVDQQRLAGAYIKLPAK